MKTDRESKRKKRIIKLILKARRRRDIQILSKNAFKSIQGERSKPLLEKEPDRENIRNPFARDIDRILHSNAYARCMDKTQVFYLFENDHITHRALHSQFVSRIGRTIGRVLNLNEDLIEAIALGHDVGHSPYGHDGEDILNNICKKRKIGSFAHNVQSVRLLSILEKNSAGLNLTLQTLDGILCHTSDRFPDKLQPGPTKDWKTFNEEVDRCIKQNASANKLIPMTLEGCVIKIADRIAYLGRDIEDAISINLISREDIPGKLKKYLGVRNNEIIENLVMDLILNSYEKDYLAFSEEVFYLFEELRKFNDEKIYNNKEIKREKAKIQDMFHRLFSEYLRAIEKNKIQSSIFKNFLSKMDSSYIDTNNNARKVIDYIANMTDDYFNNEHEQIVKPIGFGYRLSK